MKTEISEAVNSRDVEGQRRPILDAGQIEQYGREGYLILRGAIEEAQIVQLERGLERNPPLHGTLGEIPDYPAPGRYTLANNALKDPDLAGIAEHPTILSAAAQLLNDEPRLTAYVIYDRTPGGPGIPAHHDYKRWRPVGSSMNWLFTIVPFCAYDQDTGPLYVAPGSHHLERISSGLERPLEVAPPATPQPADFIDPGLRRGDLLLMNMHLWHRADGNHSAQHRAGVFNKYAAASAPPATGYYLYDDDVAAAISPQNRDIIAVHSNKPIGTTRALLTRQHGGNLEVLLVPAAEASGESMWQLPGGPAETELAIPDWDAGNVIASAQQHLRDLLRIETPWLSYVGDFDEGPHLCRVYAYTMTGRGFPQPYDPGMWVDALQLGALGLRFGYEPAALASWNDASIVRGKGLAQASCRVDQFAY